MNLIFWQGYIEDAEKNIIEIHNLGNRSKAPKQSRIIIYNATTGFET